MGGAAITIALQQLKGFLGINKFTKKTDIIAVLSSVISSAHHGVKSLSITLFLVSFTLYVSSPFDIKCLQWNWQTILISASFLIFLLISKFIVIHRTIDCNLLLISISLFLYDLLIKTGEEKQETVLDSSYCSVSICHHFNLLRLHNPSRQERSSDSKHNLIGLNI